MAAFISSSADCIELFYDIARRLRKQGLRISTPEIIDAVKIAESYVSLGAARSCHNLEESDLVFLVDALLVKGKYSREMILKTINAKKGRGDYNYKGYRNEIRDTIKHDLSVLRLSYNQKVRRKILRGGNKIPYIRLRLLGIIDRTSSKKERVVSYCKAKKIVANISKRYSTLRDALTDALREAIYRDPSLLRLIDASFLEEVNIRDYNLKELLDLRRQIEDKDAKSLVENVIREKLRKAVWKEVEKLSYKDWRDIIESNLIDSSDLARLLSEEPRILSKLVKNGLTKRMKAILRDSISKSDSIKVLSYLATRPKIVRDIGGKELVATIYTKVMGSVSKNLENIMDLMKLRSLLLNAVKSGNSAYFDLFIHEARNLRQRLREGAIDYIRIGENLALFVRDQSRSAWSQVEKELLSLDPYTSFEIITSLYSVIRREEYRRRARRLAYLLLRRKGLGNGRIYYRKRFSEHFGRLDIFNTLRKLAQLRQQFLVFREKKRYPSLILVLDKSGSMKPFSLAAMLAASSFVSRIERLVLFDEKVYLYEFRGVQTSRVAVDKLIDAVFSTEFYGYTDIVSALYESIKNSKSRKLIVISDLKQTVKSSKIVEEVFEELTKKGYMVYLITPRDANEKIVSELKSRGVSVFSVKNVKSVERVVRLLSLQL